MAIRTRNCRLARRLSVELEQCSVNQESGWSQTIWAWLPRQAAILQDNIPLWLRPLCLVLICWACGLAWTTPATAQDRELPPALKSWQSWATWEIENLNSPAAYSDYSRRFPAWLTLMKVNIAETEGTWELSAKLYDSNWCPLPGSKDYWPQQVQVNGEKIPVVERDGSPAVRLGRGEYRITGRWNWEKVPQQIQLPASLGLLELTLNGQPISQPNWESTGQLWLMRQRVEEGTANGLNVQIFRLLEDGIPSWLVTRVELSVSGKSREETLGQIVPAGWQLATVSSPLPVAIDEQGTMQAQVRAGKWTVELKMFRAQTWSEVGFALGSRPVGTTELVAYRSRPEFRVAELAGLVPIDASQTQLPAEWRSYPVFTWDTATPFSLVEKLRGLGETKPPGLDVRRDLWLSDDGRVLRFFDQISGKDQRSGRLNANPLQELGAVRVDGQGQLITQSPESGALGVELRQANFKIEAVGKFPYRTDLPAVGWDAAVDNLRWRVNLPPGYRVFAAFGADHVDGDWLTAWSLLDLFLVLVFSVAAFRFGGWGLGLVALLAFVLSYHEPGSPRLTWFFLLIPGALLRVLPRGGLRRFVGIVWGIAIASLLLILVPFVARQIQAGLYPQLEMPGEVYGERRLTSFFWNGFVTKSPATRYDAATVDSPDRISASPNAPVSGSAVDSSSFGRAPAPSARFQTGKNLLFDAQAKIQTAAMPEWRWNSVDCRWDGPVDERQKISLYFISRDLQRVLCGLRVVLLLLLLGWLLRLSSDKRSAHRKTTPLSSAAALVVIVGWLGSASPLAAQDIPSVELLNQLKERLIEAPSGFPRAAEIAQVQLQVQGGRLDMTAEIHVLAESAVPLPGQITVGSPVTVEWDGGAAPVVARWDGYLWIVLPPGVHRVRVVSQLADTSEWQWTYNLAPRQVLVEAPGWTVSGINPNHVPEPRVFFVRQQPVEATGVNYDRRDYRSVVAVERYLEVGLVWQVRTVVRRLSEPGNSLALEIPLLSGENVLSENLSVNNGSREVRMGPQETEVVWESELPRSAALTLTAPPTDSWAERWMLSVSPLWHAEWSGLQPVYENQNERLRPVWSPWPGESVTLAFSEPKPVPGATLTIQNLKRVIELGNRQRSERLQMEVECSVGEDLELLLPDAASITQVQVSGVDVPVRRGAQQAVRIPIQPGKRPVEVAWKLTQDLPADFVSDRIQLSIPAANVSTEVVIPRSRWVLWTTGPILGPAVRFWIVAVFAILAGLVLSRVPGSPLNLGAWLLLAIGLTQIHIVGALFVVGWLFVLSRRGQANWKEASVWSFNFGQLAIAGLTVISLIILTSAVAMGLLGLPEMFIAGNSSSQTYLRWFSAESQVVLPTVQVVSITIWIYRVLMLLWALWLAFALLNWLARGWQNFTSGGMWKTLRRAEHPSPPPLAEQVRE